MPYRRLPNTDAARLRAMTEALFNSEKSKKNNVVLSSNLIYELKLKIDEFKHILSEYQNSIDNQKKSKDLHNEYETKCRLYISHFLQVMNFAILRGELNNDIKKYYNIPLDTQNLPNLQSEQQLIIWGKIIIEGDKKRQQDGVSAITNPSIAMVKAKYEQFLDSEFYNKSLQNKTKTAQEKLVKIRPIIDNLIKQIWDEIENYFESFPPIIKRQKAKNFGISYVYRKNEEKIELDDILNFSNASVIQ
jgi:hypothetical protein